jgi:hypothetical protein
MLQIINFQKVVSLVYILLSSISVESLRLFFDCSATSLESSHVFNEDLASHDANKYVRHSSGFYLSFAIAKTDILFNFKHCQLCYSPCLQQLLSFDLRHGS